MTTRDGRVMAFLQFYVRAGSDPAVIALSFDMTGVWDSLPPFNVRH